MKSQFSAIFFGATDYDIFDQIFDLTDGVYFYVLCDLNLFETLPHLFFPAPSCSNALNNIESCQSNKHFHALDITSLCF